MEDKDDDRVKAVASFIYGILACIFTALAWFIFICIRYLTMQ